MSLPRYILNFDEIIEKMGEYIPSIVEDKIHFHSLDSLEEKLESIQSILPSDKYRELKLNLDLMISRLKLQGDLKIEGRILNLPAIRNTYEQYFIFNHDLALVGLHINQTGWKKEDTYSLTIGEKKLIDKVHFKEVGEHKYLTNYPQVEANIPILFTLSNQSGNSRQVMIDLEYIDTTPKIEYPVLDSITNNWDVAITLSWESNTTTDLDLHGIMGSTHVYFGNKTENNLYLNFDHTSQGIISQPEVLSLEGNKDKVLEIYVNNFNRQPLTQPVELKILQTTLIPGKYRLLKTLKLDLNENTNMKKICEINLEDLKITI